MPKVEDIFSKLNGATYFTTLDLRAGYHHIPLDKPSIPKTAFNSPYGKFEYAKVPFGLAQAPAYFQELMTGILKDFNFAIAYHDDIIIFSKTPQEHLYTSEWYSKTEIITPFHEEKQVQFLLQRNSVSRTHPHCYRCQTLTCQDTCHTTYVTTNETQTSQSLPWFGRIL